MINTSDSKFTGFNSSLATKVVASMRATSKCDKYARLASNILKFLQLSSSVYKDRFSRAYSELLILRQVLRWQGLYSILTDLHKEFPDNLKWKNLSSLLFTFLEAFSDMLDRMASLFLLCWLVQLKLRALFQAVVHLYLNVGCLKFNS